MFGDKTRYYWIAKGQIPDKQIHSFDRKSCELATIERLPLSQHMWLLNHALGHCAVGVMMKMWKHWVHSLCPWCMQENKKNNHVLLCPDACTQQHWDKLSKKLDLDMVTMNTTLKIQCIIICEINNLRQQQWRMMAQVTNWYGGRTRCSNIPRQAWVD
jgi:hypothetical protein